MGIGGSEEGDQLLGAEGDVRAFGLDQEVDHLLGCGVVGRARGAAAVEEAIGSHGAEAVDELVGGLTADAEVVGESGDRLLPSCQAAMKASRSSWAVVFCQGNMVPPG